MLSDLQVNFLAKALVEVGGTTLRGTTAELREKLARLFSAAAPQSRVDSGPDVELVVDDRLAYSLPSFAKAVDLSVESIRQQIAKSYLVPSYLNSKPLIMREEGIRWLRSLPADRS